jgi:hypothetical protein
MSILRCFPTTKKSWIVLGLRIIYAFISLAITVFCHDVIWSAGAHYCLYTNDLYTNNNWLRMACDVIFIVGLPIAFAFPITLTFLLWIHYWSSLPLIKKKYTSLVKRFFLTQIISIVLLTCFFMVSATV